MSLLSYREKRNFERTPEPRGTKTTVINRKKGRFFVQRHDASHLHYDFRLELNGVLKSWAIPKGPSLDPTVKRLAVHVEDHPLEYGTFEGVIPEHEYGAGNVLLWDQGGWEPEGNPNEGYKKGKLIFRLRGQKLNGLWALIRTRQSEPGKDLWLLIKERDEEARSGDAANITKLRPERSSLSVQGGSYAPRLDQKTGSSPTASALEKLQGAAKLQMPEWISPQLATLALRPPDGDLWLSEVKFDGYRALCRVQNGSAKVFSRSGKDWTNEWPEIAEQASHLDVHDAWLDGEIVGLDKHGFASFEALQHMAKRKSSAELHYYLFDLPYLNGFDLRNVPLLERKKLLESILVGAGRSLHYSDHIVGETSKTFKHACLHHLEGIIAKRTDGLYLGKRAANWVKIKCHLRQEFLIVGFTEAKDSKTKVGALLLGVNDDQNELLYVGKVGTGFSDSTRAMLAKSFSSLSTDALHLLNPPSGRWVRDVHWLRPALVAEVQFTEWTRGGVLRHPTFRGLRSDKAPHEVKREEAPPVPDRDPAEDSGNKKSRPRKLKPKQSSDAGSTTITESASTVAGVHISHPSRPVFPESSVSKLSLVLYYEKVANLILPHLEMRPLTLVRCPQTWHECFYQRHVVNPRDIGTRKPPDSPTRSPEKLIYVDSIELLVRYVQLGVIEFHTWGARADNLERPDRIIFDLDPAEDLPWSKVVEAAMLVKTIMEEIGLRSFLKTSGGKGLHVVVPIVPDRNWLEIKAFAGGIARHLASLLPERFTANMAKTRRKGRIFIDFLRNAADATTVAAYSARALPGAPISTPLTWDELPGLSSPGEFTVLSIEHRLNRLKEDPWKDYFNEKQRISKRLLGLFD